jgi:hypothetical protein
MRNRIDLLAGHNGIRDLSRERRDGCALWALLAVMVCGVVVLTIFGG